MLLEKSTRKVHTYETACVGEIYYFIMCSKHATSTYAKNLDGGRNAEHVLVTTRPLVEDIVDMSGQGKLMSWSYDYPSTPHP